MKVLFRILMTAALICVNTSLSAADQDLVHYDLGGGLAPYFWKEPEQKAYQGIIPDMMAGLEGIKLTFKPLPRKRLDQALEKGEINFALTHPDYTSADTSLIFVTSYLTQTKILYQLRTRQTNIQNLSEIRNATICTRLGYRNPKIDAILDTQNISYATAPNKLSMLKMLLKSRCDFLVGSSDIIDYEIAKNQMFAIEKTGIVVDQKPFYFAVNKEQPDLAEKIEKHIHQLKENGKLAEILERYNIHKLKEEEVDI